MSEYDDWVARCEKEIWSWMTNMGRYSGGEVVVMQEQRVDGALDADIATEAPTEKQTEVRRQPSSPSTDTSSTTTGGDLVGRRELVDAFARWLLEGGNLVRGRWNFGALLDEAQKRQVRADDLLVGMLDDVLEAYREGR